LGEEAERDNGERQKKPAPDAQRMRADGCRPISGRCADWQTVAAAKGNRAIVARHD
jgi:hypothetical protein